MGSEMCIRDRFIIYRRMSVKPIKYGFFDKVNNVFYEVESQEEYERCLQFYREMLVREEKNHREEVIGHLEDFADVIGDFIYNDNSSCFPEMQEFEF